MRLRNTSLGRRLVRNAGQERVCRQIRWAAPVIFASLDWRSCGFCQASETALPSLGQAQVANQFTTPAGNERFMVVVPMVQGERAQELHGRIEGIIAGGELNVVLVPQVTIAMVRSVAAFAAICSSPLNALEGMRLPQPVEKRRAQELGLQRFTL